MVILFSFQRHDKKKGTDMTVRLRLPPGKSVSVGINKDRSPSSGSLSSLRAKSSGSSVPTPAPRRKKNLLIGSAASESCLARNTEAVIGPDGSLTEIVQTVSTAELDQLRCMDEQVLERELFRNPLFVSRSPANSPDVIRSVRHQE